MPSKPLLAVLLLALSLWAAGCGGGGDDSGTMSPGGAAEAEPAESAAEGEAGRQANTPAPSGEAVRAEKVDVVDFAYNPDPVRIQVGGKVTWLNEDSAKHTATADDGSFDTGTLEEGKLKSETFKEPGTIEYHCTIHPEMHGTLEVIEAG